MKKLLSVLLAVIMVLSVMPTISLAGPSSDGKVLIREYVPGVDTVTTGNATKLEVTTVTDGEEAYYQYKSLTGAADAPLGYIQLTSSIAELTFMLTDSGSALGFMPAFYDADKNATDKYSYTDMLRITENGVVITNIKDSTDEYIFVENDARWVNHKFTLIPYVALNQKHTVRIEHNPDNLEFTLSFDSNSVTLTENASSAYVESCVTAGAGAVNSKGPRFLFVAKKDQTFRVYDMYIRGTQANNTDPAETAKIFSGARDYTFDGDTADNVFAYYKNADGNAVITGFKNDKIPEGEYTADNPLVFPDVLDGSVVVAISDYAFNKDASGNKTKDTNKYTGYENIASITLADTIKTIGIHSMTAFKNINAVVIPDSVETIGDYAFAYVYNTTTHTPNVIKLGNSLKTIGNSAFYSCGYLTSMKELVIPASVETIANSAFVLCHANTVIFEGAPVVGAYVFRNQVKLENVVCLNDDIVFADKAFGITGSAGNESTITDGFKVAGSASVYEKVKASNTAGGFTEDMTAKVSYSDIYVYKTAAVPSVYYWGNSDDAYLIKAKYDKETNEMISCELAPVVSGGNYPLETDNTSYNVSNMVWELDLCKPLINTIKY